MNDEELFLEAKKEVSSPERNKKLWAKALVISGADREKAKNVYVKMRVEQLKGHQEASQELKADRVESATVTVASTPKKRKEHQNLTTSTRENLEHNRASRNEDIMKSQENKETEIQLKQVLWLVIVSGAVALKTMQTNLEYALGYILSAFVFGVALSPIWWFATKKTRNEPWKWYDWLNTAAYAMVILFFIFRLTHFSMREFVAS